MIMEFKELFALQPADPIITLQDKIVYKRIKLPVEAPINEKQNSYILKVEKVEKGAKVEKGKEGAPQTKAERARARRVELQQARQARREEHNRNMQAHREEHEAAARERNAEIERERRVYREEMNAVRHVQPVQLAPPVRPVQMVQPVQPVQPAIHNIDAPAVKAAAEAVDPGTRRTKFWEIITRCDWHNSSDGGIPAGSIAVLFRTLTPVDTLIFKMEYDNIFTAATGFLRNEGMFERNGAGDHASQARIVSHIIALGEDQYMTLLNDPAILQFLVETGECQSLNALLPENIKI